MSATTILTGDAQRRDLQPAPIPVDHVIEGEPEARCVRLTESDDGLVSTHLWDCTAGRFHWHFGVDEIVHILDGEVHVTDDRGHTVVLGIGDVGHFALHSHSVWYVPDYVRKLAFHRAPKPVPLPIRAVRKLARMMSASGVVAALPVLTAPPL
ncbi:MAG TPA: cupin domain-containing protein [Baekduia sp.]|nr:cupin domain-containing protein [Baekduia sp.]